MLGRQRTVAQVKRDIKRTERNLGREEFWLRMMERFRFLVTDPGKIKAQKAVVEEYRRELMHLEDELALVGGL